MKKRLSEEHKRKISIACKNGIAGNHMKGRKLTEQHKENIRKGMIGNVRKRGYKLIPEHRNKIAKGLKKVYASGKRQPAIHSEETKKKISNSRKGKCLGSENKSWKGGITPISASIRNSFKYREWRSDVFTRDDFICQNCGTRGGQIEAHHIKTFSEIMKDNNIKTVEQAFGCEELWNINNGVTFCCACHSLYKGIESLVLVEVVV